MTTPHHQHYMHVYVSKNVFMPGSYVKICHCRGSPHIKKQVTAFTTRSAKKDKLRNVGIGLHTLDWICVLCNCCLNIHDLRALERVGSFTLVPRSDTDAFHDFVNPWIFMDYTVELKQVFVLQRDLFCKDLVWIISQSVCEAICSLCWSGSYCKLLLFKYWYEIWEFTSEDFFISALVATLTDLFYVKLELLTLEGITNHLFVVIAISFWFLLNNRSDMWVVIERKHTY